MLNLDVKPLSEISYSHILRCYKVAIEKVIETLNLDKDNEKIITNFVFQNSLVNRHLSLKSFLNYILNKDASEDIIEIRNKVMQKDFINLKNLSVILAWTAQVEVSSLFERFTKIENSI